MKLCSENALYIKKPATYMIIAWSAPIGPSQLEELDIGKCMRQLVHKVVRNKELRKLMGSFDHVHFENCSLEAYNKPVEYNVTCSSYMVPTEIIKTNQGFFQVLMQFFQDLIFV